MISWLSTQELQSPLYLKAWLTWLLLPSFILSWHSASYHKYSLAKLHDPFYGTCNLSVTSSDLNHVRGSVPSVAMLQNRSIKKKSKSLLRHTTSSREGEKMNISNLSWPCNEDDFTLAVEECMYIFHVIKSGCQAGTKGEKGGIQKNVYMQHPCLLKSPNA